MVLLILALTLTPLIGSHVPELVAGAGGVEFAAETLAAIAALADALTTS